jgi:ABC-type Mn2+/Zn2+ transport system ATPase subunit
MLDSSFSFSYPNVDNQTQNVPLNNGDIIFILGANGTGKSGLIHKIFTQNMGVSKRISAHRQMWFNSNALDFTPASRMQVAQNINSRDSQIQSRWKDENGVQKSQVVIFDLINAENIRAREIAKAVDQNDIDRAEEYAKSNRPPIEELNHLLQLSNLPIEISVEKNEKVFARKNNGTPYSIAELSDGERNAILIASDILTAEENTLFLIDEPERHLHRSIISPLLSSLFQKRSDCAFIISTHDVGLPMDNPESNVLVVRGCEWNGAQISTWDADLISAEHDIDYHVKKDILGSRRTLLFIEGNKNSLDQHIYQILFPDVSVIPQGNCKAVEQVVNGISSTETLHWVKAFGLIDADDRQSEDLDKLKANNIFSLPCYSVESLYYSEDMIYQVALRQASVTGEDVTELKANTLQKALEAILPHKERLCARLCERKVRAKVQFPDWRDIKNNDDFSFNLDLKLIMDTEVQKFDSYVLSQDINSIIGRYPVRETPILNKIVEALGFQNRGKYESAVRQLLIDKDDVRLQTRNSLGDLVTAIAGDDMPF